MSYRTSFRVRFALWWRQASPITRSALFLTGLLVVGILLYLGHPISEGQYPASNLLVFVFINLTIVCLCLLIFLVGRSLIKLIFERRKRVLGSHLRLKLVFVFVGLVAVPTVLSFVTAQGLLSQALDEWFSSPVDSAVNGAVELARGFEAILKERVAIAAGRVGEIVENTKESELSASLVNVREELGLFSIVVLDEMGKKIAHAEHPTASLDDFSEPDIDLRKIRLAETKEIELTVEGKGENLFVRAYLKKVVRRTSRLVVASIRVPPEFSAARENINEAKNQYEQSKFYRNPLRSAYVLVLALITGLILFSAIWTAIYLARGIVGPIQQLAEASDHVARGNYDIVVRAKSDDEIGFLVSRFNEMVADLKETSRDAERRRELIETILENLAVGVVALDAKGRITSINGPARKLFSIAEDFNVEGRTLPEILAKELAAEVIPFFEQASEGNSLGSRGSSEHYFRLLIEGREHHVIGSAGIVRSSLGIGQGVVLVFDDITELAKAQQAAAWREVARRIAHEIKNPLTPIQLSAQRLEKLLREGNLNASTAKEALVAILENVDSIKRLANEFSEFARMPAAHLERVSLNSLLTEILAGFSNRDSRVTLKLEPGADLPEIFGDREQIRRLVINLVENAYGAFPATDQKDIQPSSGDYITVITSADISRKRVLLEVRDTGIGIKHGDKSKIFEPYYTTKKGGTGLGLAIVTAIVNEHHGIIRVMDNLPRGARFVVELPVKSQVQSS